METNSAPLSIDAELKLQFDQWTASNVEATGALIWKHIDTKKYTITFQTATGQTVTLGYPSSKEEGGFFMETSKENPLWAQRLNDFIFSRDGISFVQILSKIQELDSNGLKVSVDDLKVSQDEVEEDDIMFTTKNFVSQFPERAKRIMEGVKEAQKVYESNIRFNEDSGQVILRVELGDILTEHFARSVDLLLDEPLIITLDFAKQGFAVSDDTPPQFSILQRNNKSKNLKKNVVKELVRLYIERNWGNKRVVVEHSQEDSQPSKRAKTDNTEAVQQLKDMGFDPQLCEAALADSNGNSEQALDKLLNGQFFLSDDIMQLMDMGFDYKLAKHTLQENGGSVEKSLDKLLSRTPAIDQGVNDPVGECGFFDGLIASVRSKLKNYTQYCCICSSKHICNRMNEKPVICSVPLCMFRYEELGMGVKFDNIYLCPFSICPAKYDPKDRVMNTLMGNEATTKMSLETLLDMYKSKYAFPKYLPHEQMLEFVEKGVKANNMTVKSVTNVLKPENVFKFEAKWEELNKLRGGVKPQMAYHGTGEGNIPSILDRGLLVPEQGNGVKHATDSGYWGKGIYLSPNAQVSVGYCRGKKLLICSVLMGKSFQCTSMMNGGKLVSGYDSHMAPGGQEWIIFDPAQVLCCYVVEFA